MKKLLALVLTLTMVLGTFTFVAAAPEDVVGTDYEDAVARLMALDIIAGFPDGTFKPDEPVTRAQFAKIVVCALGVGEAANYAAGATKFADVPADHWATGYINVAVDMGVIAGYPDGTFKPESQVTFAEAIKMIVAGLGYTPKAEALGGYPGGYLAVAAEEEITDGVNVVGNLAANRGAVAIMVDNALEVNLMEQVSFGDSPRWETVEKTLLKNKLGVEETKGVVTAISKTAKLDENEFELDGKDVYEMVIDVNTESLFLKEVKILHKDEKVVWVSVETAEKDILFDTVEEILKDNEEVITGFKLKVADKKYDLVEDDFVAYVNYGDEADENDVEVGMYGYFIFDGKEIKAANLFDFEDGDRGFVTKVDDDEIEYIDLYNAEEQLLALDDYDEIFVYNKDFTKAEVEDIDENTVMYYWEDDDELFVMIVDDVVEGTVTRIRTNRVTIDGKNYSVTEASIISSDEGDEFKELDDVTEYDVIDEEVVLYLDLNGDIAALVTGAEATSETKYGLVTWFYEGRNPSVEVFTSEGEEVEYFFEERADAEVFAFVYEEDGDDGYPNDNKTVWAIKYELNSDNEIAEDSIEIIAADEDFKLDFKYHYDGKTVDGTVTNVTKRADRKYVDAGSDTYYIGTDTVIMKALDKDGSATELDPEVIDYETLVDMAISSGQPAIIFGEEGKTANMIVFLNPEFEGTKDDVFFGVVVDNPWKVGSNWFAEIDVFGEGKDDYKVATSDNFEEGELVAFTLKSNDEAKVIVKGRDEDTSKEDAHIVSGVVYDRDGSYITINKTPAAGGDRYKVASGAVMYEMDGNDIDGTIRLTRIADKDEDGNPGGDKVAMLYDTKEREVVAILVWKK